MNLTQRACMHLKLFKIHFLSPNDVSDFACIHCKIERPLKWFENEINNDN